MTAETRKTKEEDRNNIADIKEQYDIMEVVKCIKQRRKSWNEHQDSMDQERLVRIELSE